LTFLRDTWGRNFCTITCNVWAIIIQPEGAMKKNLISATIVGEKEINPEAEAN